MWFFDLQASPRAKISSLCPTSSHRITIGNMFSDLIRGCYSGAKLLKSTPSRTPYATRPRINRNKVSKSSANYKAKNVVLFYFVCCRALLVQGGGKTRGWERPRGWDDETTRLRDCGTTRPRDHGTTRPAEKNTGVLRHSQAFSVVRGCAWQLVVRVVQMWCQVEVWLDGGVLGVHPHSDERAWCRRCAAITTREMRRYHDKGLVSEGRRVLHSAKMPSMGSTCAYVPLTAFFVRGRNRPLITPSF